METIYIPTESDFRKWIREAVKDLLEKEFPKPLQSEERGEELLTRKEIAAMFRISLVTLHAWMNTGMPFHKQGGRVYFLRSEVVDYVKQKRRSNF